MSEYPRMETIPVASLVKNDANPNEQDDRTFNALCQSIQEEGWVEPMATAVPQPDGTYEIVGGHHRYDAAMVLGIEEGPVWLLDPDKFDQDRRNWTMLKVNIVKGTLNPSKFTALYNDMVKKYDAEVLQALMGFTDEDAFKSLYRDVKKALPPALQDALGKQKDEIRTIDDLSLVLNRLFRDHGETLDSNYMTFSFGGKEVLWVRADKELWELATSLVRTADNAGLPAEVAMAQALTGWSDRLEVSTAEAV